MSGLQKRQQSLDGGADVTDETEIDPGTATEIFWAQIDLRDFRVRRKKLAIGKVRAEQEQRVASHHRVVARGETDEAGHSDVIGIVIFDKLLAAERVDDRRL